MWNCNMCNHANPEDAQLCAKCGSARGAKAGDKRRRVTSANYDYKPQLSTLLDGMAWAMFALCVLSIISTFVLGVKGAALVVSIITTVLQTGAIFIVLRALSAVVWDSSTTKALIMQMYDKDMNE